MADVRVSDLERRLVEGTSRPNFTVETLTALRESVDPAILGGLVVKIGSTQIDSSIRTRLNSLAQAMKG